MRSGTLHRPQRLRGWNGLLRVERNHDVPDGCCTRMPSEHGLQDPAAAAALGVHDGDHSDLHTAVRVTCANEASCGAGFNCVRIGALLVRLERS
jgi:hypothetical protein